MITLNEIISDINGRLEKQVTLFWDLPIDCKPELNKTCWLITITNEVEKLNNTFNKKFKNSKNFHYPIETINEGIDLFYQLNNYLGIDQPEEIKIDNKLIDEGKPLFLFIHIHHNYKI